MVIVVLKIEHKVKRYLLAIFVFHSVLTYPSGGCRNIGMV